MGASMTRDTAPASNDDATDDRGDAGGRGTDSMDNATAATVMAPLAERDGGGVTRPVIRVTTATGRNASRVSWLEAGRSETPQRADFLAGDSAPRVVVMCRMAGLFWVVDVSRYNR